MKRIVKRTGKSLWQVFKELDFDEKCRFISTSFGLITIIFIFVFILLLGFGTHWLFGIFTVLVTVSLLPLFVSGLWGTINSFLYDEYYTVEYEYDTVDD